MWLNIKNSLFYLHFKELYQFQIMEVCTKIIKVNYIVSVVVNKQSIKPIDMLDCMDSYKFAIKTQKFLTWNKIHCQKNI